MCFPQHWLHDKYFFKICVLRVCPHKFIIYFKEFKEKHLGACWHLNKNKCSIKSPELWKSNLWAITLSSRNVAYALLIWGFFFFRKLPGDLLLIHLQVNVVIFWISWANLPSFLTSLGKYCLGKHGCLFHLNGALIHPVCIIKTAHTTESGILFSS